MQQWENLADLWYKKDDKFKLPKAIVAVKVYTNDLMLGASPMASIFTAIWNSILGETLREFSY